MTVVAGPISRSSCESTAVHVVVVTVCLHMKPLFLSYNVVVFVGVVVAVAVFT